MGSSYVLVNQQSGPVSLLFYKPYSHSKPKINLIGVYRLRPNCKLTVSHGESRGENLIQLQYSCTMVVSILCFC